MKKLLILCSLISCWPAWANFDCPRAGDEAWIKDSNPYLENNLFVWNRSLNRYGEDFPFRQTATLDDVLADLTVGSTYVDMGGGGGRAVTEALKRYPNISRGVAITYKLPEYVWNLTSERYEIIHGDYVENQFKMGKLNHLVGHVDLITDDHGTGSYARDLRRVFQINFELLKKNGLLIFNLLTERNFKIIDGLELVLLPEPLHFNVAEVEGVTDVENLKEWIRHIPGTEVVEETEEFYEYSTMVKQAWSKTFAMKLRKTASTVVVPADLLNTVYLEESPPQRSFRIRRPPRKN